MIPLGPPGECVPAAMISGTRDDTPKKKKTEKKGDRCQQSSPPGSQPSVVKQAEDG